MFKYKPVESSDLPLIHEWLGRPHIAEWIHGQGLQNTLIGLGKFVSGQPTSGVYWIAYLNAEPFAFLISAHRDSTEPELANVPFVGAHVVGVDIFIGDVKMTGKGLGTKLIKDFLLTQFEDATDFAIEFDNIGDIIQESSDGFFIILMGSIGRPRLALVFIIISCVDIMNRVIK